MKSREQIFNLKFHFFIFLHFISFFSYCLSLNDTLKLKLVCMYQGIIKLFMKEMVSTC